MFLKCGNKISIDASYLSKHILNGLKFLELFIIFFHDISGIRRVDNCTP